MTANDDELSDYLAGRIPLDEAEELDRKIRHSASLQARLAQLASDPMIDRLRKVWLRQDLLTHAQPGSEDELGGDSDNLVDRYRLIELIGTGGMGQVWKAKPVHGSSPPVALKLVKPGLDSKSILERFEVERKTLAMMDHPCIAKVLDGGSTDQGQSYFVMELVNGPSITEYCDLHQLGVDQRLKLFVQVCRAVQHAHQKGIIHRDLKPSNILVTQYDGQPLPKVIDFGLAKALGDIDVTADDSQLTEYGALVGTVRYMSPEQVEMNSWDIDTRSDIYSLGAVLYELVTGTTPIQWAGGGEHSLLNVLQSIRETEPPKPSERLSSFSDARPASPQPTTGASAGSMQRTQRGLDYRAFLQVLRHDLDWIVMKAIEKKRERRYQTADSLAQDIDRYLTGQPVAARPPSAIYRLGKFVKKHRGAVTVAMALLIMTMAGVASLLWSLQADSQKRAVYAASSYSSIINELNLLAVSRRSGWTHRGLQLIEDASAISTPLQDSRQLRDWAVALLTTPDFDMTVGKRFTADLSPTDLTYSPSGRRLAVGLATTELQPQTTIVLIDLETDQQRWLTPDLSQMAMEIGSDPSVTSLRFGQDDDTLFVGTRNGWLLRLQLDRSPTAIKFARASRGGVLVRLSKDGRYCVTATSRQQKLPGEHDERVRCFDATTLEQLGVSEFNERVRSLSIAPDCSRLSISSDILDMDPAESIEHSLPSLERLRVIPGENALYHSQGHAIFTGKNATYNRFHIETPFDAAVYLPDRSLAWQPHRVPTFQPFQIADDGRLLAAAVPAEKSIYFWREAEAIPFMKFRLAGNRNIIGYALSPTMESMAVMTDEALELYNYTDRRQFHRVISLQTRATQFAVSTDQGELATLGDLKLTRYKMPTVRPFVSKSVYFSPVTRNAIAYDSINPKLVSIQVREDRTLEILISKRDEPTSEQVFSVRCEPEERFDAPKLAGLGWIDDEHLVAAIDFRLMVWNTNSQQLDVAMPQHNPDRKLPSYRAIAIRRDQCVTITEDGRLDHWRWTGKQLAKVQPSIELHTSEAERLAWHPGGNYVIVGTQSGSIQSIDLKLRQLVSVDEANHNGEICGAAWCDAERLVTASRDGKLALWQLSPSGKLKPYVAWDSRSGITAIDVKANGKLYVASAGESISVFDLVALDAAIAKLGIGH